MRCSHSCEVFADDELLDQIYEDLENGKPYPWPETRLHTERQDTNSPTWQLMLELIEEAAKDGRKTFSPRESLEWEVWSQIITLPPSIGTLKCVKKLNLYGSNLLSIPPEIGEMENLEEFVPYTSHGLHWFPYEITRCKKLRSSTVSTRALYGNYKYRPPFPRLNTKEILEFLSPKTCSVCSESLIGKAVTQVWLSRVVATDVLPLLVNACSQDCLNKLPAGADGYITGPHAGGCDVAQPAAKW
jgi:hypothetical protein